MNLFMAHNNCKKMDCSLNSFNIAVKINDLNALNYNKH